MSQVLAKTRLPVNSSLDGEPNVLLSFIGDYGTMYIRADRGRIAHWYLWTGLEWTPSETGYDSGDLWKYHKCRAPSNVEDGWAGIAHAGPYAQNWTKKDIVAAFKLFEKAHAHEYTKPDGKCWDPFNKGRLLKRRIDQAAKLKARTERAGLIVPAPADLHVHQLQAH